MSTSDRPVVTRFAPSPTGFLHIGGARTALFNYLFARHCGGQFLLRIEDTDRKRSTEAAIDAILDGLTWLGLPWDGEPTYQFASAARHAELAHSLLKNGRAYHCYCSPEELADMRAQAKAEGRSFRYDGRWRDRDPAEAPAGVDPVVRLKMPQDGETVIHDAVQGQVTVANNQLDDMILLRADGTPTYMLSVVVDDHDMGISHIIRGDDHLTNAFRQKQLFEAFDWPTPTFAHIPLIHGPDGSKLSKRHGALGVEAYRDDGYLPEALRNYLLRLGWSHGDDEIISDAQAIDWFDLGAVGRSAARFDFDKLASVNAHYLQASDKHRLVALIQPPLENTVGRPLTETEHTRLAQAMPHLTPRSKTLLDLTENAAFLVKDRPLELTEKAQHLLTSEAREHLYALHDQLSSLAQWDPETLEQTVKGYAAEKELKLGKVAQPLRAALSGSTVSPGIFDVLVLLGRSESLGRISDQSGAPAA